jgi:hypothetical protein
MNVTVEQIAIKPDEVYPYNYRVEFKCQLHESEQIGDWINQQGFEGLHWIFNLTGERVFYTTKEPALLCKLRWS